MRFRRRLQLVGLSLVLAPSVALSLVYGHMLSRQASGSATQLASGKLGLLENRLSAGYEMLNQAGLADSDFYLSSFRASAAERFAWTLGPGEAFAIVSGSGEPLDGALRPPGSGSAISLPAVPPPQRASFLGLVSSEEGARKANSPFFGPGADFLAWRRFEPVGWTLIVGVKEQVALKPLRDALAFSGLLAALLVGLASALMVDSSRRLGEPLSRLARVAEDLGRGGTPLKGGAFGALAESKIDEVRELAQEFDLMAQRLGGLTGRLETMVSERTEQLSRANRDLVALNADLALSLDHQERLRGVLVQSEKLAALGQLVAGIAHELNTPLAAIDSAAGALREGWEALGAQVEELAALDPARRKAAVELAAGLSRIETLDRSARAALRTALAAELASRGVEEAERLAVPLAESNLDPSRLPAALAGPEAAAAIRLAGELADLPRSANIVAEATRRASRVIEALRIYVRQSKDEDFTETDLALSLDRIVPLFSARFNQGIELLRSYEEGVTVLGQPDKLAQVWSNLILNAIQAMDYNGTLELTVRRDQGLALVGVRDTGPGIPPEIQDRVFAPFFTTKPPGEGTGLGLEISRRIVEDNGGRIRFETSPSGTTFLVELPLFSSRADAPRIDHSPS